MSVLFPWVTAPDLSFEGSDTVCLFQVEITKSPLGIA